MKIFRKEVLSFTREEREALSLVREICLNVTREATNPNLRLVATEAHDKLMELWTWEDED
jgi:hypothetical protein